MTYQGASGWNNVGSYVEFTPQPQCDGLFYPISRNVNSGLVYADGSLRAQLVFNILKPAQYIAILTAWGLSTTDVGELSGLVTARLPSPDRTTFADYNATVVHDRRAMKFLEHNYHNVVFLVKKLVVIP